MGAGLPTVALLIGTQAWATHEKADTHIAESPNVGALLIQVFHKARA